MTKASYTLQIGEAARLLGVTTKTLRFWEKRGLLRATGRSASGYRHYTPADLLRLQRIQRLQRLGLSLDQIKMLLGSSEAEMEGTWRAALHALHADVTAHIEALSARRERIAALMIS